MTVYKRNESAVWQCKFSLGGVTVRESTGKTTKAEAQAWEVERRRQVAEDLAARRRGHKRLTLHALAQEWLAASEVTHRDHRTNLSRVRKLFGDELQQQGTAWVMAEGARYGLSKELVVHELAQADLVALKAARLKEGNAPATVNREMSLIQTLLGYAKAASVVVPSPPLIFTAGRNKAASLKMKERKGKLRWLRPEEEAALLASLREEADQRSFDQSAIDAYDLTMFLLDTGARYKEVAEVCWSQCNLAAGIVSLYRGKVDNEGVLTLPQRTLAMLRARAEAIAEAGLATSYVFPALLGRSWNLRVNKPRGHATRSIQRHIDLVGINSDQNEDRATPHTFRDTFAARLVQAGVSIYKVSKLLGHANVTMTQKYAHLSPEATGQEAARVLDRLHGNKPPQGDDPIVPTPGHSSGRSSIGYTKQFMLHIVPKNPQVIDLQGDFEEEGGGTCGDRTHDKRIKSPLLYQLS